MQITRRIPSLLLLTVIVAIPSGHAGTFQGYTILAFDSNSNDMMQSTTNVDYTVDGTLCGDGCAYKMTGYHYIAWSRTGDVTAWQQWTEGKLNHRGIILGSASSGECYFSNDADILVDLTAGTVLGIPIPFLPINIAEGGPYQSGSLCRPRVTVACKEPTAEGCPPTGSECQPTDEICNVSPIIVDLGGGYVLTGIHDGVSFDIDADGSSDRTSWTAAGSSLAFLVLDRNGNGQIDNGTELFGDASPTPSGKAANGFEALAQYDVNLDGSISESDPVWLRRLWVDTNHDGVSQPAELTPIASGDILELGLDYRWTGRRDQSGNTFRYKGEVHFTHGSKPYYDVFLVKAN